MELLRACSYAGGMERFDSKVSRSRGPGCWEWTAAPTTGGYGRFWMNGKSIDAHRAAWIIKFGSIPRALCVCHQCDNKMCVRPSHLFLGTRAENQADMKAKGRSARGSRNAKTKLSVHAVLRIRKFSRDGRSQHSLARLFNVSRSCIAHIVRRDNWAWL